MAKKYHHSAVEKKWQREWERQGIFSVEVKSAANKTKVYVLDMFPYPSAQGLHVGHPEGYTASDIVARYLRMKGLQVLHPMGFDAFGLPAENYAIKTGTHPAVTTAKNIKNMRKQIQSLGFSYDWNREVITSDPKYYKWTQWIFVQLYKHGLAYEAFAPINWCPSCKTGLANEEVVNGKCERCGTVVTKKQIKQWLVKITDERYIERLLHGLDKLDWPENIKLLQRNWIGRSEGASVMFRLEKADEFIEVFTTRPDTLFGATYMVLSPEHPLVDKITTPEQRRVVGKYQIEAARKSDLDRTDLAKEKSGVFTGAYAINPVNEKKIPIWIADYVLSSYGTGAIMAVPAHDERDFAFAKKFKLPIKKVIDSDLQNKDECFVGEGKMVNSGQYDGMESKKFKEVITEWLHKQRLGNKTINYKLRDWLFSRQRYWGEPIPIVHCESCKQKKSKILIIHGTGSSGQANWYPWLAEKLRSEGHEVFTPDMPDPSHPDLGKWLGSLREFQAKMDGNSVVIGHSLGAIAAMHFVADLKSKVGKLILVAPTHKEMDWVEYAKLHPNDPVDHQKKFNAVQVDFSKLQKNTSSISYYYSDNDFYIPVKIPELYKKTLKNARFSLLPGRNHFSLKNGNAKTFPELYFELHNQFNGVFPLSEDELPLELPNVKKYEPTGTGESPLASIDKWVNTNCPQCGGEAKRETNTMPQWAGSNWYFLRYCDPKNEKLLADPEALKKWLPVDIYVGGAEHAVLHLLYARFVYKFLYDIGAVPKECGEEPFIKLKNQGLILGEDNQKMSKSRGNVVNPDDVIKEYGADAMRMYEMFMGPFEDAKPWNTNGIVGMSRFLERIWQWGNTITSLLAKGDQRVTVPNEGRKQLLHKTIKKVTEDIESFRFNTAISQLMILFKDVTVQGKVLTAEFLMTKEEFEIFLKLLSPFAPHLVAEMWENLGHKDLIDFETWPVADKKMLVETEVSIPIQINGKVRDQLSVSVDAGEDEVVKLALASEKVKKWTEGRKPKMAKYIKGRIITIAV